MPYTSRMARERARWMTLREALAHIETAEHCSLKAAWRQLGEAVADREVDARWPHAIGCQGGRRLHKSCRSLRHQGSDSNPRDSALNKYLQSWDCHNLFVVGANVFPHNASYNPTGPVGALAYWTADAIKNRYLKNPGPLVPA
jgi:choline dehydrogenase-like flavoprotein